MTYLRMEVLRAMRELDSGAVGREDIFRHLLLGGSQVSLSSVYRVITDLLEAGWLVREWSGGRKALYRLKPDGFDGRELRMACPRTGRSVVIDDPSLMARILAVAEQTGFDVGAGVTTIVFGDETGTVSGAAAGPKRRGRPGRA
ncbi:Fur family transcriptional regulator [Verticiella sediminum]|nr:transcriptional repressor [Verticiella sediminum]